jgi:hypothetical protein
MKKKLFIPMILIMFLASCATIQDQWNKLTPDEKARIIINDLQTQLSNLWDTGKAYVDANPQYLDTWKQKIVPIFDTANKNLKVAITLSKMNQITPDMVYENIQPSINSIIVMLVQIGAIKK